MSKETLKLALEALKNSVDLVVEDAYNAEKLYGNYPSRQAKVGGLKVLAEDHKQAIKALEEALAKQEQRNVTKDEHDVLMKALAKSGKVVDAGFLAKQEQGETVAVMELHAGGWDLVEDIDTDWLETLPFGTKLYTTPQQRTWVGLTDEDKKQIAKEANYNWEMTTGEYAERIGRLTEAKLKEKNT